MHVSVYRDDALYSMAVVHDSSSQLIYLMCSAGDLKRRLHMFLYKGPDFASLPGKRSPRGFA